MHNALNTEQFKQDVFKLANDVGVHLKEIHIRKMTKKWASCSSRGRLTFDPALLEELIEKRTEAVLHELLHLRYPNHGKMFYLALNEYLRKGVSFT